MDRLHLFRPTAVKIDYEDEIDHEHDLRGLFTGLEPAEGFGRGKANLVKNTMNDGISELLEGCRPAVEGGGCRHNNGTSLQQGRTIADMNQIPGGFPWHQNQLSPFLEKNVGGAENR